MGAKRDDMPQTCDYVSEIEGFIEMERYQCRRKQEPLI
jgi:heme-degrading monooxygenase HmoA